MRRTPEVATRRTVAVSTFSIPLRRPSGKSSLPSTDAPNVLFVGGSRWVEAAGRLALALERSHMGGVVTNRDFLVATLRTPEFASGDTTTDFIERVAPAAVREVSELERHQAMIAVVLEAQARRRAEEEARRKAEQEAWLKAHPPNYVVQRGDHLWGIAGMSKIYEASKFWPLIYDANRGQINDPDLIFPNQNLTIPREMSDGEMIPTSRSSSTT